MDTLEERYALLTPDVTVYGPKDDDVRPAVILFHGCGGMREHIHTYAQAAADLGVRAYVVDSFKPRGWDRNFAVSLICTGAVMQGYERSGDVLAMLWGLKQSGRVDMTKVILAGFSHGGWAIMDLMTEKLDKTGAAKVKDPDSALADGVAGVFLVYPYINFPARSNRKPWVRAPKTFAVLAEKDHLTPIKHAGKVFDNIKAGGASVDLLTLEASHAFDEKENQGMVMSFSEEAMHRSMDAMIAFIRTTFALEPAREAIM
ncbi:dienelactone hydrolase family protein [Asticcacaulis sp. AC402]|uniref:dienelactone hydrolase family protein n=1 Tax=Asticcacaulis sp. AC402 TaxID=1282361 RepID=UPI0003C3E167|nr:dienelactone hydrolase family protein [Asticcacaulis sp. AC402]ESQ76026.1 dienelactone hydrolase [Asticcacaulis sp. AC402]